MPINYAEYHPQWKKISLFIRKYRAKNKCEWCGVENGKWVLRGILSDIPVYQDPDSCTVYDARDGRRIGDMYLGDLDKVGNLTKIVLTVAHIDQNKNNNSFFNLASLCQRCHLNHDRKQHIINRRNGRNWKRGQTALDL